MSTKANPAAIGAFAVGAVVLAVAAILTFGSGKLLSESHTWVAYFDGSVKGLRVGAPVMFRGVPVGEVSDIIATAHAKDPDEAARMAADELLRIAVYMETQPDRIRSRGDNARNSVELSQEQVHQLLLDKGMKAQLELESMVTGLLAVQLDFHPDKPARLVGEEPDVLEIPTVRSSLQDLADRVEKLPIDQIAARLLSTLDGIDEFVNSPRLGETIAELKSVLADMRTLVSNVNTKVEPLSASLANTSEAARRALAQAEQTLAMEEGASSKIALDIRSAIRAARQAFEQVDKTFTELKSTLASGSDLPYELSETLAEVSAMVRSMRALADYLEQNPDALLRGKRAAAQ